MRNNHDGAEIRASRCVRIDEANTPRWSTNAQHPQCVRVERKVLTSCEIDAQDINRSNSDQKQSRWRQDRDAERKLFDGQMTPSTRSMARVKTEGIDEL